MYSLTLCMMLALCIGLSVQQQERPPPTRMPAGGMDRPMHDDRDMDRSSCGCSRRGRGSDMKRMLHDTARDMMLDMMMPRMMMPGGNGGMMGGYGGMMGGYGGMMGGYGGMMGGGRGRDYDRRMMDDDCDDRCMMDDRRSGCRDSRDHKPPQKPKPKPRMHIPCEITQTNDENSLVSRPCGMDSQCTIGPVEALGLRFVFCSVHQCPTRDQMKDMAGMMKEMGMGMHGMGGDNHGMDGDNDDMGGDNYGMDGDGDDMDGGRGEKRAEEKFIKDIFMEYMEYFKGKGCAMEMPDGMGDMGNDDK